MKTIIKKSNGLEIELKISEIKFFEYLSNNMDNNIIHNEKEYFFIGFKDKRCNFLEVDEWNMLLINLTDNVFIIEDINFGHYVTGLLRNFQFTSNNLPNSNIKKKKKTYVMYDNNTNLYKIGKSHSIIFREKTLSSQMPLIKTILYSDLDYENILHEKYAEKRVRGEWFNLDANDILDIIKEFNFIKYENKSIR